MIQINTADFRASMASYFDKAYNGEQVLVSRKNQIFLITPIKSDELTLTPELQAKINKSRQEIAEGKGVKFDNRQQLDNWLESL